MSPGQIAGGTFVAKFRQHTFEIAADVAWLLVGFNYLINSQSGNRSPIGQTVPPFDIIWSCFYVGSFPLLMVGLFKESQRLRVTGLLLLMWGLFMQFVAAVAHEPLEPRDFTYIVYFIACLIRVLPAAGTVRPLGRGRHARTTST